MVVGLVSQVLNLQEGPPSTTDNLLSHNQHQHHGPLHVQPGAGDHEVEAAGVGDVPAAASLQPLHTLPPSAAVHHHGAGDEHQAGAGERVKNQPTQLSLLQAGFCHQRVICLTQAVLPKQSLFLLFNLEVTCPHSFPDQRDPVRAT